MNKLFLALLLVLPLSSMGQSAPGMWKTSRPTSCTQYLELVRFITTKYEEIATFDDANQANEMTIALFRNTKTGTWTLFEYDKDRTVACVLGAGKEEKS